MLNDDSYSFPLQFQELNSQLNREVLEHERSLKVNTNTLGSDDSLSSYEPSSELEREATTFVLGGGQDSSLTRPRGNESPEERRRRVLEATMARLKKEEEELEGACGTTTTTGKGSASEAR